MFKPGDFVGPYEIRGFIGQGGMGQVYRAFDPRLERTIALKIILVPESARTSGKSDEGESREGGSNTDDGKAADGGSGDGKTGQSRRRVGASGRLIGEFSARLLREARAVASLSHPNVVAIYDVGESEGQLYLAMEYVVGSSLRNLVGDANLPLSRRVRWLVDVAQALEAAHKAGIIHRDIKPENVMVREDGGIKVLDFGIARRTMSSKPEDQQVVDTVTGGGAIAGTPVYMAPEQIKGGEVDARCDQFAWAVMAYELVTGARPWAETGDVLRLVANILTEEPPSIRAKVKDVPKVVEETIVRALAKKADARFQTMADVAAALEPFASLSTGGERVRVTPRPLEDDAAYAATTKIPTTVSVDPLPNVDTPRASGPSAPRRRALSLGAPLVLLGALAAAVYVVKTRPSVVSPIPVASAPRPLSTVPAAEAAYKDAMGQWHDGAGAKARTSLAHAIELDPTFATAHLELALQYASMSETAAAQASFQSAYEHRRMLVHRDERLLEASEPYIRPKPDVEEWETRIMSAIFEYPRDPELQYYLGRARQQQGDRENAKAAFVAALRLDEGFVPALAALAKIEQGLGNDTEALATTDRCIRRSPVASTCVQTRYELFVASGQCKHAREEATTWGSLEPQSPLPFGRLARALHADKAPRPSVEEVLARRWSLVPPARRKEEELWDRTQLAVLDGDFGRAEELAREYDAALPPAADSFDHALPGRLRVNLLMEMDRMKDASKASHGFLDRLPAWPSYPFAPDPSLDFFEPIYRAGEMTKRELDERRTDWALRERQRSGEGLRPRDPWTLWANVHGSFAETREEAADAFERAPRDQGMPGPRSGLYVDFTVGKVLALLGKWDLAMTHLQRVVASCETFDHVMVITRARLFLAQAEEAKGDLASARANYEKVIETWPKATPSRTLKRASERLAALDVAPKK